MAAGNYDLTEQAAIYGSYHNHPMYSNGRCRMINSCRNRLIHGICVPAILFATVLWLALVKLNITLPGHELIPDVPVEAFELNIGMIIVLIICAYYSTLDVLVGVLEFVMLMAFSMISNVLVVKYTLSEVFYLGLFLQIVGWGFQVVVGHGYFEGRKPAIGDSLFQAIVSPFFLMLELLFLFGYRKSLCKEIDRRVARKIAAWKATLKKGK